MIKNYREKDWRSFKTFVRKHYHPKYILQNKKFFDWQFKKNPYSSRNSAAMKILCFNKKILGHLGLIPLPLKFFDKKTKGAAFCNLMVDQSCRAFGMGYYLTKSIADKFKIAWGTGYKPKSAGLYTKTGGWHLMGDLNRYVKILNAAKIKKILKKDYPADIISKKRAGGKINIKQIKQFSNKLDNSLKKISFRYPVTVEREAKYLNWRYCNHPFFDYKIFIAEKDKKLKGYIIFRIARSKSNPLLVGHILDLIAEKKAVDILIETAEKYMAEKKADLIDYYSSGLFHHKNFLKLKYRHCGKKPYDGIPIYFNPIDYKAKKINFLIYWGGMPQYKNRLCNPNNWYITKGDGDKDRPNTINHKF